MKAPSFWWARRPTWAARLLAGIGWVYGAVTARRMARAGTTVPVPVICIGNFIAGGAGKTPTALAVASLLQAQGHAPFFLTRGYGGAHRGAPLRVDPAAHEAALVGDEALLLAAVAPTIVAADRVAGARAAVAEGASVIIMDDGLQSPALAKALSIAVVDGGRGFGNGLCVPAGPLRAPVVAQVPHVQAILAIGLGPGLVDAVDAGRQAGIPTFRADLDVDGPIGDRLAGQKVLAFAGIGDPQKFYETLRGHYATIVSARAFADHYPFTEEDAAALLDEARARNLMLVTTQKDAVRLAGKPALESLRSATLVVPVRLRLPAELAAVVVSAAGRRQAPA